MTNISLIRQIALNKSTCNLQLVIIRIDLDNNMRLFGIAKCFSAPISVLIKGPN